jgi:SAM-dependent methyltransferase
MDLCGACGTEGQRTPHVARELMLGLHDQFTYAECGSCGALELVDVPADMSRYYPAAYYSYADVQPNSSREKLKLFVKGRLVAKILASNGRSMGFAARMGERGLKGNPRGSEWINPLKGLVAAGIHVGDSFLDVGCGSGHLLNALWASGMRSIAGIDPFLPQDAKPGRVPIYRETVFTHQGQYDSILFNHSYEHLEKPVDVLKATANLLKPGGHVILRIPVADSYAWRTYGVHWYQLDTPRHIFIHTRKSMKHIAEASGFELKDVWCDSYYMQFTASELYKREIPLADQNKQEYFTRTQIEEFARRSEELNAANDGDQATFLLRCP